MKIFIILMMFAKEFICMRRGVIASTTAIFMFYLPPLLSGLYASVMPVPVETSLYEYGAVLYPVLSDTPQDTKPVGVGAVTYDGDTVSIGISLPEFDDIVDIYFAISAPSIVPDEVYVFDQHDSLVPLSDGLVKWRSGTKGALEFSLGDIPVSSLPPGRYTLYLVVTPVNSLDTYYFWKTEFQIPEKHLLASQEFGPGGGVIEVTDTNSSFQGVTVVIPQNALTTSQKIALWEFVTVSGLTVLEVTPLGLIFNSPIEITFPYDQENAAVLQFDLNAGGWQEAFVKKKDPNEKTITVQVSAFKQFRLVHEEKPFDIGYFKHDRTGKIAVNIISKHPLSDITPDKTGVTMGTYGSMEEWLQSEQTNLHFIYRLSLFRADSNGHTFLEEKSVRYYLKESGFSGKYTVVAEDSDGGMFESNVKVTLTQAMEDWVTGAPKLILFDTVPQTGMKYFVTAKLYIVEGDKAERVFNGETKGYFTLLYGTDDQGTATFPKQSVIDYDMDGIVDKYDAPLLYNPGVSPLKGSLNTTYTFYVRYHDPEGDIPLSTSIFVDGQRYEMYLGSGSPSNGVYFFNKKLNTGRHRFYMLFADNDYGGAVQTDVLEAPDVSDSGVNAVPSLLVGGVTPYFGDENTTFDYFADFFDFDGDSPPRKWVYINGGAYSMNLQSGVAGNGRYAFTKKLSKGCFRYKFHFTDGNNGTVKLPSLGNFYAPAVSGAGAGFSPSPLISCPINNNPELSNGGVTPEEGDTCTDFTFYVDYYDRDGDPPSTRLVYINGVPHGMTRVPGGPANGTYAVTLNLPAGYHSFYFFFNDGKGGETRFPLLENVEGPEVFEVGFFSPGGTCD